MISYLSVPDLSALSVFFARSASRDAATTRGDNRTPGKSPPAIFGDER
jgi:hypothetical protein